MYRFFWVTLYINVSRIVKNYLRAIAPVRRMVGMVRSQGSIQRGWAREKQARQLKKNNQNGQG